MGTGDTAFSGQVPAMYDRYLGPLLFEPYASELARRLAAEPCERVLETAAGTGIVTRRLCEALSDTVAIEATDLNGAMVEVGQSSVGAPNVRWSIADAQSLPFAANAFDAVACQFGVMFFPDKEQGYREVRRVLRPGGRYIFAVWNSLDFNDLPRLAHETLAKLFPDSPPQFIPRVAHGYYEVSEIERALRHNGFDGVAIETLEMRSRAPRARDIALGWFEGTPLRGLIEERDASGLSRAVDVFEEELRNRYGDGPIDVAMSAHIVTAR
jgi:ubiquinone/menaquinone biosynthesis C-methylase UbiE